MRWAGKYGYTSKIRSTRHLTHRIRIRIRTLTRTSPPRSTKPNATDAKDAYQVSSGLCELQTPSCPGPFLQSYLLQPSVTMFSLNVARVLNGIPIANFLPLKIHHRRQPPPAKTFQ